MFDEPASYPSFTKEVYIQVLDNGYLVQGSYFKKVYTKDQLEDMMCEIASMIRITDTTHIDKEEPVA